MNDHTKPSENDETEVPDLENEGQAESGSESNQDEQTSSNDAEQKLRRAMADLANVRKRQSKDLSEARQRAIESLTEELLPVVDNFHLALGATETSDNFDPAMIVDGLKMVRSMLESVLERHGLTEIQAAGQTFDPNQHEAVGVDSESDAKPGTITQVVQRGYTMNGKVIRASRVMVRGE